MENLRYSVQKFGGEVLAYFADLVDAMAFADVRSYIASLPVSCERKILVVYDREEQVDVSEHFRGHPEVLNETAGTRKYCKLLKELKDFNEF